MLFYNQFIFFTVEDESNRFRTNFLSDGVSPVFAKCDFDENYCRSHVSGGRTGIVQHQRSLAVMPTLRRRLPFGPGCRLRCSQRHAPKTP